MTAPRASRVTASASRPTYEYAGIRVQADLRDPRRDSHLRPTSAARGASLYPAFLLAVCLVELARRWRSTPAVGRDLVRFATTATAVSLAVSVPFVLLAAHNWFYFWTSTPRATSTHTG